MNSLKKHLQVIAGGIFFVLLSVVVNANTTLKEEHIMEKVERTNKKQLQVAVGEGSSGRQDNKQKPNGIIDLFDQSGKIFQATDKQVYAAIDTGKRCKVCRVQSPDFEGHIIRLVHQATGVLLLRRELRDTLEYLSLIPLIKPEGKKEIHIRYAMIDGAIYIDLANPLGEIVKITKDGWEIILHDLNQPYFHRYEGMKPLPRPVRGGSLKDLSGFLNIRSENQFILAVGWLLGSMYPNGPFSMLVLLGPQGSSKSTMLKMLRSLVDPSEATLSALPRSMRDLFISAMRTWLLSFDNVSKIKVNMSDGFCRLTNEGSIRTRRLFTNSQEVILRAKRPVIFNGISYFVQQNDFIDRSIFLDLPAINPSDRKPEKELWESWVKARPLIQGALYDALAAALANLDQVSIEQLPRTADFARWVIAAESSCPWESGAFLKAIMTNRTEMIEMALEDDCVGEALLRFMEDKDAWTGNTTELLNALKVGTPKEVRRLKDWPKAPNKLSNRLMRLEGFLSSKGLDLIRERKSEKRLISLKRKAS